MKKIVLSALAVSALLLTSCVKDDGGSSSWNNEVNPENWNPAEAYTVDITLDPSVEYKLTGAVVMAEGTTLTIPAGTKITATGKTSSYIAISTGAKINVQGTASNPVVMTSGESSPKAGDWGGLVICGDAPTNKGGSNGESAQAEVSGLVYGGTDVNDNSGSVRYLRVEYTGATFTNGKEFNGVSLFAVGAGTTFEYVQSHNGGDDGIEFFGGTVNGKYLISTNSGDDAIDFADGWSGNGENWFIKNGAKAGIEGSNNGDNGAATPMTNATLKNISIVGGGSEGAIYLKEGSGKWNATNIFVDGYDLGVKTKSSDSHTIARIDAGDIVINPIELSNVVKEDEYLTGNMGTVTYYTKGTNTGAGNGASAPTWASGWSVGL